MSKKWKIKVRPPFKGLAPSYCLDDHPTFGMDGHFSECTAIDLTNPNVMTQGEGQVTLTNGDENDAVTTLIKAIYGYPKTSDTTYATGGNQLYQFSSTAVTDNGTFPHTIDKATVTGEDGNGIQVRGSDVYYWYNHSGDGADIGKYNGSTFDDDWGTTVPTGTSTMTNAPHPTVESADGLYFFGNGNYVGRLDVANDEIDSQYLTLQPDAEVVSLIFEKNVNFVAYNTPGANGSDQTNGRIVVWDGQSQQYQEPVIEVSGQIGTLFTKDGIIYCIYRDLELAVNKIAYISGDSLVDVPAGMFSGSLPLYYQIFTYKNHVAFLVDQDVFMYGRNDVTDSNKLFKIGQARYSNDPGGFSVPFSNLICATSDGSTGFDLSKLQQYNGSALCETATWDIAPSVIDKVVVMFDQLASGAGCTVKATTDLDDSNIKTIGTISFANDENKVRKTFQDIDLRGNFIKLTFDWSSGSTSNPCNIRGYDIEGHTNESDI